MNRSRKNSVSNRIDRPSAWRWLTSRRTLLPLLCAMLLAAGCSRTFWRNQADTDVYNAVADKVSDPEWAVPRIDVTPDPRSRFFDSYDLDNAPLPPDDPAAGRYMLRVAGKHGYKSWHKFGERFSVENPHWLTPYGLTPEIIQQAGTNGEPSSVPSIPGVENLTLNQAIELSYIHNRDYQTQIENVYLRSLELTFERFQFDVRYLGLGGREPTVDATHSSTPHGPNNVGLNSRLGVSQLLPSGGQAIVELANNTLWMFSGPNSINTASVLSYSIVQPLLFQAGRKIALENLTQSERNVLYAVRDLARFRKEFFTDVVSGQGGFLGVLLSAQLVENERDNIRRTRDQLEVTTALASQATVTYFEDLPALPAGIVFPPTVAGQIRYDAARKQVSWRGFMSPAQQRTLRGLSADPAWQTAVANLIRRRIYEPLDALPAGLTIPQKLATQLQYAAAEKRLYWRGFMNEEQEKLLRNLSGDPGWRTATEGLIGRLRPLPLTSDVLQIRNRLLNSENTLRARSQNFQDALDRYKILLGLPPNVKMGIDLGLLNQFKLIDPKMFEVEERLKDFVLEWAKLDEVDPDEAGLRDVIKGLRTLRNDVQKNVIELLAEDRKRVKDNMEQRLKRLPTEELRRRVLNNVARDDVLLGYLQGDLAEITRVLEILERDFAPKDSSQVKAMQSAVAAGVGIGVARSAIVSQKKAAHGAIAELREALLRVSRNGQNVQVGLRTELVKLEPYTLSMEESVRRALDTRLDLKNARARVMDARRQVEIAANRLEAVLNLRVEGDIRTRDGNKPLDFRARQSNFRVGVGFTAPLDMVNERNIYRDAQIAYQRARRDYMAIEDQIKRQVRESWRDLDVLRQNFETSRQSIRSSSLEYDNVVEDALRPGQGAQGGGRSTGLNLLNALNNVLRSQNDFIQIWVNYETSRLNIHRDMGIMEIDPSGLWVDSYYQRGTSGESNGPATPLPPTPLPAPAAGRSNDELRYATAGKFAGDGNSVVRTVGTVDDVFSAGGERTGVVNLESIAEEGAVRRIGFADAGDGRRGGGSGSVLLLPEPVRRLPESPGTRD